MALISCPACGREQTPGPASCVGCGAPLAGARSTTPTRYGSACVVLLVIAAACGFIGAVSLSQATAGIGFIALGCLAAIFGRIAQAGRR